MVPPPSSEPLSRTLIVTVSYGSGEVLDTFLKSVPEASTQRTITVVADNKPEGDPAVCRLAEKHGARYLKLGRNLGYGGAVNRAVEEISPAIEWILVSNPDVGLGPGAVDLLVAAGESDARIGSVGPAIFTTEGDLYPSARRIPSLRTGIGHALLANLWNGNPWTRAYRDEPFLPKDDPRIAEREAGWLSGACVLVRRSAFEELGGFDESFFMYFEDVDLGYRLGKLGYKNVYLPSARVVHTGAHSTTSDSSRMIEAHHRSARRFLGKKYPQWWLWPVRAVLTAGLVLRSWLLRRNLER